MSATNNYYLFVPLAPSEKTPRRDKVIDELTMAYSCGALTKADARSILVDQFGGRTINELSDNELEQFKDEALRGRREGSA